MPACLTPEQYCFRYMWPCAEIRKLRNQIDEDDFRILNLYRNNLQMIPSREVLYRCFPDASRDIELLGESRRRDSWSMENLVDYWHHYHEGNSPVLIYRIAEEQFEGFVVTHYACKEDQIFQQGFLFNSFYLKVKEGDLVYGHAYHATEKVGS